MKSISNIVEILNDNTYSFSFNYDYKDLVKFFNIYNTKRISMISGSIIITDKEYLNYAGI